MITPKDKAAFIDFDNLPVSEAMPDTPDWRATLAVVRKLMEQQEEVDANGASD
jgi:hypothetical protein